MNEDKEGKEMEEEEEEKGGAAMKGVIGDANGGE